VTWSVRHGEGCGHTDRVLDELTQLCQRIAAAHLPSSSGYETSWTRLSGALEGASITIMRGSFRGVISVQRFARPFFASVGHPAPMELRVVASACHEADEADGPPTQAMARWGVAGCAVGTMGIGSLGLELAGVLSAWGQILLLIPAFMAWRICMVLRFASDLRREGVRQSAPEQALARERARIRGRDREQWNAAIEELATHRDSVAERFCLRPFRSPGQVPGTAGSLAFDPAWPQHAESPPVLSVG
jgi:hypothetical protein